MKHLPLTTIAAVLLVGCGPQPPDISIHISALLGEHYAVHQHLILGTDPNALDKSGYTPLHHAAREGHTRIVEMLIIAGANVNAMAAMPEGASAGWTPLHAASSYGHYDVAELLIVNGANINQKTPGGATPLDFVAETTRIAKLLRGHGGKTADLLNAEKSIHTDADAGHTEAVKQNLATESAKNKQVPFFTTDRWQDILCISLIFLFGALAGLSTYLSSKHEKHRVLKSIGTGLGTSFIIFVSYLICCAMLVFVSFLINKYL